MLSVQVKSANGHWEPAGPAGTCTLWGQSACADGSPMSSPRAVMSPRISQNAHDLPAASPTMSSPRTRRVLSVTPLDVTETGNWGQVMTPGGQYAQNQPTCTDGSPLSSPRCPRAAMSPRTGRVLSVTPLDMNEVLRAERERVEKQCVLKCQSLAAAWRGREQELSERLSALSLKHAGELETLRHDMCGKLARAEAANDQLQSEITALKDELSTAKSQNSDLMTDSCERMVELVHVVSINGELRAENERLFADCKLLAKELQHLKQLNDTLVHNNKSLIEDMHCLAREVDTSSANVGFGLRRRAVVPGDITPGIAVEGSGFALSDQGPHPHEDTSSASEADTSSAVFGA